ncbi:NACHT, LRR and PYD domains-containing protein 3-like [Astyanax mexicanus]|uniref:NACHT, LRR and PYD domains-containing protein 3-like n=1 Tax=Astyanax mexicanus TaxID=7994 RepID=UPI0020CB2D5C|nr:NACHT, LRR and PYD domains-containing protein 3-like [Astyanax mexicanus]
MDLQNSSSGAGLPVLKKKRTASPAPSGVSMKSDRSMGNPPNFSSEAVTSDPKRKRAASPAPSGVSMKSDRSMGNPPNFSSEAVTSDPKEKITLNVLRKTNEKDLPTTLESKLAPACQPKLKSTLREKCQRINEGITNPGTSVLLNEIYTELYITQGGGGEINQEHEVRQIEDASRKRTTQELPIKCNNIFTPLPEQNQPIRTVLTKGVAGIGKTVSVQKFILDWADGKANQDVLFIFPLPFRELNLMKEKKLSLVNLLQRFFPETQDLKPRHYKSYKIMFIFDGLMSVDFL